MNSSVKVRGTNPINVKVPALGQSRRYFLAFLRRAKTRTLGGVGGGGEVVPYRLWPFWSGIESMVFEGTTGAYERIDRFNSKRIRNK